MLVVRALSGWGWLGRLGVRNGVSCSVVVSTSELVCMLPLPR